MTVEAVVVALGVTVRIKTKVKANAIAREEARISKFQSERRRARLARECRRCLLGGYIDTLTSVSD